MGGIHGGIYATLIDTAAYWAAYCDLPEDSGAISLDLTVDNLSPAGKEKLVTRGRRLKAGRTIFLCEAEIEGESGKKIARGTSKVMVTPTLHVIKSLTGYMGGELPPKFID